MPRHPPYALKRLNYAQKKISVQIKFLLECSSIRTFMIVLLFEQSDIDIDKYLQCKKAKSVFVVEDSGIEPLTS